MSDQSLDNNTEATDATDNSESQAQATKTYTQEEFDRHMAGLKSSLQKKYEKTFAELGDLEELKTLKAQAEQKRTEEAMKKGEFEKILQEKLSIKDSEIQKRDAVIKEYKINTPLLSAAAQYRAVNAEQVKALLSNQVRLNELGDVEVVDGKGLVRYNDAGEPLAVNDLVREFLDSNPHFVSPSPATTNSKSNISSTPAGRLDISKLDMKNPEHRKLYQEAMSASRA
jgi:hypothetical protein